MVIIDYDSFKSATNYWKNNSTVDCSDLQSQQWSTQEENEMNDYLNHLNEEISQASVSGNDNNRPTYNNHSSSSSKSSSTRVHTYLDSTINTNKSKSNKSKNNKSNKSKISMPEKSRVEEHKPRIQLP